MVTIEEINKSQDSCENANDNNTSDDDPYAWKDLMGKDIRFRLLSSEGKVDLSQTPEAKDFVRLSFRGYIKNENDTHQLFTEKDNFIIVLGEADVPPGLEMGIRFCPIGCSAQVTCTSKFAYGDRGRKKEREEKNTDTKKYVAVPPSCELQYSFVVHEIINYVDDLQQIQLKKAIGNESFQYDLDVGYKALLVWKRTLTMIDSAINQPDGMPQDTIKSLEKIKIDLHNNIALVYYNQKQYNEAKSSCNTILNELDEKNSKACIRLGYILLELDVDFSEINQVIQKAASLSSGGMENTDVRKLYSKYKKKKLDYIEKRKEVSKKMMKNYNLSNNDNDQQEQKEDEEGPLNNNKKDGYNFIRHFGTMEFLLLLMIALTANEIYHHPDVLDDVKYRWYKFVKSIHSMASNNWWK